MLRTIKIYCFLYILFTNSISNAATHPRVTVSLNPFYSLVTSIMGQSETVSLLVKPGFSPHDYSLKPSEVKQLYSSDIVVWGTPQLEGFLTPFFRNLPKKTTLIQLDKAPNLKTLLLRSKNCFHHAHHSLSGEHPIDPHFWLDTDNALALIDYITTELTKHTPAFAKLYLHNATELKLKIQQLKTQLTTQLAPVTNKPFLVMHDGYQYFEKEFSLKNMGTLVNEPEAPVSAQQLRVVHNIIKKNNIQCIFSEPQFPAKIITTIIEDLKIRAGILDPLGAKYVASPDAYFSLMQDLGNAFVECLP